MIDLHGHTALITGSSQGVGRSIAQSLATVGSNVIIHGHERNDAVDDILSFCRDKGVLSEWLEADLSGDTQACVENIFTRANSLMQNIDILINNAGTFSEPSFLDVTPKKFEQIFRLNVASGFFLTQAFAKKWIEEKTEGRVLFTGSINGILAEPDHTVYDTSKAAVSMMVKTLCVELARKNIRVNGLAPGLVRTPLTKVVDENKDLLKWMELHTPNGEVPGPDVCGETAAFLVSDAARHIHGQMILIDGGMSIWQQPDFPENN